MKKISIFGSVFLWAIFLSGCASFSPEGTFKLLDKDANGILSYPEFYNVISSDPYYQEEAREKELSIAEYSRQKFDKADDNRDGYLSFQEFKKIAEK